MKKKILFTCAIVSAMSFAAIAQTPGTIDNSFTQTGLDACNSNSVNSILALPGGEIMAGGNFSKTIGTRKFNSIARIHVDGSIDSSFNSGNGILSNLTPTVGDVSAMIALPGGKVLIGGAFSYYDTTQIQSLARVNADGSFDTTFNVTGSVIRGARYSFFSGSVKAMARQADGKVLIGGDINNYNNIGTERLARINVDGSLDTAFHLGIRTSDPVDAIAIQANGKIWFSSSFFTTGSGMARLNTDGSLDTVINLGIIPRTILIQPNGQILVGSGNTIMRLNSDGSKDNSFNPPAFWNYDRFLLQQDSSIVCLKSNTVRLLKPNGTQDTSFNPNALGTSQDINALALTSDAKILIAGNFIGYIDGPGGTPMKWKCGIARLYGSTPTGVAPLPEMKPQTLVLHPNPASEYVTVSNLPQNVSLKIMDVYGRTVFRQQIVNGSGLIPTTDLPNGIYFVVVTGKKGNATSRLVIER